MGSVGKLGKILTDEQKRKILGENALRFYGMGVPAATR